ncbi:unnamed protein product [Ambrosiozyma monospora]|uniref:Unnamed protein product n=1 Tax=Ambrosiozyma monospora TaxID=43982 RepID=A0ACB5UAR3_AMBMO|nr:unnamed protein product [Ambrosiozyma monospora]
MNNFDKLKMTELVDLLNFVSQICHNGYNSQSIYIMLNSLLTPLIGKVIARIERESASATDDFQKRDVLDLQRSFIAFLIALSNDHLNSLWLTAENKETLTNIINLMLSYIYAYHQQQSSGVSDGNGKVDLNLVKISIGELNALVQGLGSGKVIDPEDTFKNDNAVFESFESVLINNKTPSC